MPDKGLSRAEQLSSQAQAARNAGLAQQQVAAARVAGEMQENVRQQNEGNEAYTYDLYDNKIVRTAWVLTTARRQYLASQESDYEYGNSYQDNNDWNDDTAPLIFNVNPNSYQLDNPFRQNVVDTKGGPVIHTYRDPNRGYTNFGFATMNIEMSSGSLMPRAKFKLKQHNQEQSWTMPPSVGNFYRFLEIVQEDTVYQRENQILPNYQIIKMSTLLFPRLTLYGYFIQNANWSEQAENPTEVQNWQVQFKIYKTTPAITIDELRQLYSKWEQDYNDIYVSQ